jgi:N-formylmaleamate deformylase
MLAHWTQNDVRVGGVRLHYYRTGPGDGVEPPGRATVPPRPREKRHMVFVHGFSDNGLCWTPVARDLESEYDVIMPDMRAHGLSERVRPGENVDMAADLAGLIRALGLRRPIVGGHSMGAMAAYQIGVRFPELAGALVLEDPPWWLPGPFHAPPPGRPAENPMMKWAKDLRNHTLEELLVGYRKDHPDWPEELIRPMCESKKQLDPTFVDNMADRMPPQDVDWLSTIGNITCPMLLFAADPERGGIVTPGVVAKVRELSPKATVANVPDVGHFIRFDGYAAFMYALRAFLKQV